MDPVRFDRLVTSLSQTDTRRGLVRLLSAVPLGMALVALLGEGPDASAKKGGAKKKDTPKGDDDHGSSHRRHRRKTRNARRSGDDKDNRKGKRKSKNHQPDPAPIPGCAPNPDVQTCAGHCGMVKNNCGQNVTCSPCPPAITAFTASPTTIDRGATPAEEATLSWTTSNATSCSLDDGTGSVPVTCNDSTVVGSSMTTTYTLSATGPGGGPVTAQTTITVQYCHSITSTGHTCSTGNTQFCRSQAISATSSDDAKAACEACYNQCLNAGCAASVTMWMGTPGPGNAAFQYAGSDPQFHGEILRGEGAGAPGAAECAPLGARWAP